MGRPHNKLSCAIEYQARIDGQAKLLNNTGQKVDCCNPLRLGQHGHYLGRVETFTLLGHKQAKLEAPPDVAASGGSRLLPDKEAA